MESSKLFRIEPLNLSKIIGNYICAGLSDENVGFLLDSYYNSLQPLDIRSKFYNAFIIIEYLESKYAKSLPSELLIKDNDYTAIEGFINKQIGAYPKESKSRIISTLRGIIKNQTLKTRAEKLVYIINECLGCKEIEHFGKITPVDKGLCTNWINARNKSFHAGEPQNLKNLTDLLILLIQQIIIIELETITSSNISETPSHIP